MYKQYYSDSNYAGKIEGIAHIKSAIELFNCRYRTGSHSHVVTVYQKAKAMKQSNSVVLQRVAVLRWLFPLSLLLIAALYQTLFARWVHSAYGERMYFIIEAAFFGSIGPLVSFWAMTYIYRWLSEKEQVEKFARASERRLASITSASADAIIGLDAQGRIEFWNRGAELLFGYMESELRGCRLTELFSGNEAAEVELSWLIDNLRREGYVRGHETTCLNSDAVEVIVDLTATQIADENGKPLGMSVIMRDITDRKRRENEIQRLNASLNDKVSERTQELAKKVEELRWVNAELQKLDQVRAEFVSVVSHQLRAPLTNMNGAITHIKMNCDVMNSTCSRMVIILSQQLERMDHLVRDVLNAARIEAGELVLHREPISILPVTRLAVDQMNTRVSGRSIRLIEKPGLPMVLADRDRVVEVLVNLLDNADKYASPGCEILVETAADDTEVTLTVRDSGPGLPPASLDHLFDKFYRIDNSDSQVAYGYGLGLYICRCLVEAHGGRIWAENVQGGALFSFTLPVEN